MKVKVMQPSGVSLEAQAARVVAEGLQGHFALLPRHVDTVTALAKGIVTVVDEAGEERHLAVNGGVLVKAGDEVLISTPQAVLGPALGQLRQAVEQEFAQADEREKKTRTAMARIEAGLVRRFLDL